MIVSLAISFTLVGAPSVQDFLPCTAGQAIVYRWYDAGGRNTRITRTDRIEGQRGRLCFVRRQTREAGRVTDTDVYVLEMLADRILDAGWQGALTAFRAPLLRAPLNDKHRWLFNRVEYRVEHLKHGWKTPAGSFKTAIRVHANSVPRGMFSAARVYAHGVGVIEEHLSTGKWVAIIVLPPRSERGP